MRRIYEAQKNDPSPGDFMDCERIGLDISDNQISKMQKHQFRKLVKSKTSYTAFKYLQNMQQGHSKMKLIKYEKFELTPYLNSPVFNNSNRILLLAVKTRTVRGIRSDFGGLYPDKMCPLGCGEIDNLENILSCRVLRQHHKKQ